jgi:hypothetical protein
MAVNDLITFRKGIASEWISANPVLASGEPGYDLTNSILKIGNGFSNWVALSGIGSTSVGGSSSSVGVRGSISTTGTLSSFNVSEGYSPGYLDLFQNGVKLLGGSDFTATDGTSVTLSNSVPSGTVLEYVSLVSSVSSSNYTKLDNISSSFNGSSTSFGLAFSGTPYYPVSANTLGIYVGGVAQEPISSYSISGSNIVFTEAPASGLTFWGVGYGTTAVATLNGIAPGSSGYPAISSSNDLTTGFYFPSSGNISVAGNLGIGTSSPSSKLHVVGNINATSGNFSNNLQLNNVNVSVSGHSHTVSDITNFNSSVSGLLSITNIIAGSGINVSISGTTAIVTNNDTRWNLFLPSAPTGLSVTRGNGKASLSWTAPTGVIVQAPITDYREQYSDNNGSTWTMFSSASSTATSGTITGLTNGTAYVFRVAAVNDIGLGAYTVASSSVTPIVGTPPNAPTSLTVTPSQTQASLTWTAPSAPGTYAITGYIVEYTPSGGSAQTVNTSSTATTYTLTGLTNGISYAVRVAAVSDSGTGTYTASSNVTPSAMAVVTGGTVTTPGDGYTYHTFTSSDTLSISGSSLTADVLVVGGGGGGGRSGGGGGGVLYQTGQTLNAGSHVVTVAVSVNPNTNAGSSSLGASYTATGGAGGVQSWVNGGTSGFPTSTSNTTGNPGGAGDTVRDECPYYGGGGGGAGGAGSTPPCDAGVPGGGAGAGRVVFGTTYGAGGNGVDQSGGTNAPANLGRGGSGTGSRGGSGIVVIRYIVT